MAVRVVARVLLMNAGGEVLLCRSRSGKAWVIPGGTLETGETLRQAALREALEEVGLAATLGPVRYISEFRPADREELVVEVTFLADAPTDWPIAQVLEERSVEPAGLASRPWAGWWIVDPDGPRREVRWFGRDQLAALTEPVYPKVLRDRFWTETPSALDPYLGLEQA